jgi:hypothetical protein
VLGVLRSLSFYSYNPALDWTESTLFQSKIQKIRQFAEVSMNVRNKNVIILSLLLMRISTSKGNNRGSMKEDGEKRRKKERMSEKKKSNNMREM